MSSGAIRRIAYVFCFFLPVALKFTVCFGLFFSRTAYVYILQTLHTAENYIMTLWKKQTNSAKLLTFDILELTKISRHKSNMKATASLFDYIYV